MKQKVPFGLIFLVGILCGFISCRALHPIPLEEPSREKAQKEKTAPERTAREKITEEKTIPQQAPQQEAVQKKSSPERMSPKTTPPEPFARIYKTDFSSCYGQTNDALQDYAKAHKGNSFQVFRLGSEAVILKGVYLREKGREKYIPTLTIKPMAPKKCRLEIKFDTPAGGPSSSSPDKAAKEIFQIIEKGMLKPGR